MKPNETILLGHGSGGRLSNELIRNMFVRYFSNETLSGMTDSALLAMGSENIAFTTDSFVVDPLVFPGGDIGKLAVAGTVNDLAVAGAIPLYLTAAFIIEEGFRLELLEQIVASMAEEAAKAGVFIVSGDTKVVERGKCDKLFINTSGIGRQREGAGKVATGCDIKPGDAIIVNGFIGDHGMAVMSARKQINVQAGILSDCASLNQMIDEVWIKSGGIRFMRDATRGGLGAVSSELVSGKPWGIDLFEEKIPLRQEVRGMCEVLGFDPVYVANEGKVVMVVDQQHASKALDVMRSHVLGIHAEIIGTVTTAHPGRVWMKTSVGGSRIVDLPAGEQLPRIC